MERLTDKRMKGDGFFMVDPKEYKAFVRNEKPTGKQIYQRLLEVEDILGEDYDLDRLRELVEADREGRCFVSDVKIGGEVFYIPKFNGRPYCGIQPGHVRAVAFTKAGKRVKIREHHAHNQDFMIGKTVFLTREAAEAALKCES